MWEVERDQQLLVLKQANWHILNVTLCYLIPTKSK